MEQQTGESELLLTCRRTPEGVTVLRCAAGTPHVVLPDRVLGAPVTALGPYALSQREPDLSGCTDAFRVHVTCGGPEPRHDASVIRSVVLPTMLRTVGDYTFYNCRNLSRLTLTGSVERLGSDSFMNCPLQSITLTLGEDGRSCLRPLLADCVADLEVVLRFPGGAEARLFFPAWHEELELLAAPHIFQTRIQGGGYACRQCVRDGIVDFGAYDSCLDRFLAEHDFLSICRMALDRLRWPLRLSAGAASAYRAVLSDHGAEATSLLLDRRDTEGLSFLLSQRLLSPAQRAAACDAARQRGNTEALALLLEDLRPAPGQGLDKSFDL